MDFSGQLSKCHLHASNQLTEDGLTSLTGLSARLYAEKDFKVEAEVVPTLPQQMEGLIAMETVRNLKPAAMALALCIGETTSAVVRSSPSRMALLVSVTQTTP